MIFKLFSATTLLTYATLFAQLPCKKFTIKACINHESLLHIKNGTLTWEEKEGQAPGTNKECGSVGITRINGNEWKDWKTPYKLDFNTNGLNVKTLIFERHEKAELIQSPSVANAWETIYRFFDPSDLPHSYSISFTFCPPGYTPPKDERLKERNDSVKERRPSKPDNSVEYTEDIICKVSFEVGKKVLTKNSESDLHKLTEILKANTLLIEISGYKTGDLKLYEERSLIINNFIVSKGINQKRIKYIGYGDGNEKPISQKTIKCCVIIN